MNKVDPVRVSHAYTESASALFQKIKAGALFRLTGADEIDAGEFEKGASFKLTFKGRGTVSGEIIHIVNDSQLYLKWNVDGFEREPELDTEVRISLIAQENGTTITIEHSGIKSQQSADAKKRAWTEILQDLENSNRDCSP